MVYRAEQRGIISNGVNISYILVSYNNGCFLTACLNFGKKFLEKLPPGYKYPRCYHHQLLNNFDETPLSHKLLPTGIRIAH
jgi:hypothetical protein